ncbi:MAG: hypothetical protein ACUVSK_10435 [Desulfotomaculales bacterium]
MPFLFAADFKPGGGTVRGRKMSKVDEKRKNGAVPGKKHGPAGLNRTGQNP